MAEIKEMLELICSFLTVLAFAVSAWKYFKEKNRETKLMTMEAFDRIQTDVLDNFALVDRKNAELMIDNMHDSKCKEAYDGYRVLIARLDHFSLGVNEKLYDFDTVDKLAGKHLIYLFYKVEPIINHANKFSENNEYYKEFVTLVTNLMKRHPETNRR